MKNVVVHSILPSWLRCGEVPVPGTQPFPCSFTCFRAGDLWVLSLPARPGRCWVRGAWTCRWECLNRPCFFSLVFASPR